MPEKTGAAVLRLLLRHERPLGGSELARLLAADTGTRVHANTVYRALRWLIDGGRVRRIASRRSYAAIPFDAQGDFLILLCSRCERATHVAAPEIVRDIEAAARRAGFRAEALYLEMIGQCPHCRRDEGAYAA